MSALEGATGDADYRARDELSACGRCLSAALELFGDEEAEASELPAIGAVLEAAQKHLEAWCSWGLEDNVDSDTLRLGYDALDGILVVRALLAAGIVPRNSTTIDPRAGTLRMSLDMIERACVDSDNALIAELRAQDREAKALEVAAPATTQ